MITKFTGNGCDEFFITLEGKKGNFKSSVNDLIEEYVALCNQYDLSVDSDFYIKIYLSDISNQMEYVNQVIKYKRPGSYHTFIGQAPASGAKISLEAYHVLTLGDRKMSREVSDYSISINNGLYQYEFGEILPDKRENSYEQTKKVFETLINRVAESQSSLSDNVLRTWLYVRDIDNSYEGMIQARKECFVKQGMTSKNHYIASTGIEGKSYISEKLVKMDYLVVQGIDPRQIVYMSAPQYMNPTYEYGVTFERGTKIVYGNKSHYYISGTASIDNKGVILYCGDVLQQAERALQNINGLLSNYDACIEDMKVLIIYIRDFSDYDIIKEFIRQKFNEEIPYLILHASVCRIGWLIEIEGIAVNSYCNNNFTDF